MLLIKRSNLDEGQLCHRDLVTAAAVQDPATAMVAQDQEMETVDKGLAMEMEAQGRPDRGAAVAIGRPTATGRAPGTVTVLRKAEMQPRLPWKRQWWASASF